MISIRTLTEGDASSLDEVIDEIEGNLEHKEWWFPVTKKARSMFFDGKSAILVGAFDGGKLVAACGLFFFEVLSDTNVSTLNEGLAEIGRCMVIPEYRGDNLMLKLNRELVAKARELGKKSIVATSHPDNVASCRSLEALGFTKKCRVKKWGNYTRNYYTYEIK